MAIGDAQRKDFSNLLGILNKVDTSRVATKPKNTSGFNNLLSQVDVLEKEEKEQSFQETPKIFDDLINLPRLNKNKIDIRIENLKRRKAKESIDNARENIINKERDIDREQLKIKHPDKRTQINKMFEDGESKEVINSFINNIDTATTEQEGKKITFPETGKSPQPQQKSGKKFDAIDSIKEIFTTDRSIDLVPFVSGIKDVKEMAELSSSAFKLQNDTATEKDIKLVQEYLDKINRDTTFGAKVIDTIAEIPSFAGEFFATGGAFTAGKKLTIEGIKKGLKKILGDNAEKLLKKNITRLGLRVTGGLAGAATQTPLAGGLRITADAIKRSLPDISEDDAVQGGIIVSDNETDILDNLPDAIMNQFIELASERSGGLFTDASKAIKNQIIKAGLLSSFLKVNKSANVSDFQKIINKTGYNGVIQEVLEERVGDVGRALTGLEDFKIPSMEQLGVELVAFSVPGAGIAIANNIKEKNTKVEKQILDKIEISKEKNNVKIPSDIITKPYFPSMQDPLHEVRDWELVETFINILERGEKLPRVYMRGELGEGEWLSGTHRVAASEIRSEIKGQENSYEDLELFNIDNWLNRLPEELKEYWEDFNEQHKGDSELVTKFFDDAGESYNNFEGILREAHNKELESFQNFKKQESIKETPTKTTQEAPEAIKPEKQPEIPIEKKTPEKVVDKPNKNREILENRKLSLDTKEGIKRINKLVGGKIQGRSSTTSSIYTVLKDGKRLRFSKHRNLTQRGTSDIEVTLFDRDAEIKYETPDFDIEEVEVKFQDNWNKDQIFDAISQKVKEISDSGYLPQESTIEKKATVSKNLKDATSELLKGLSELSGGKRQGIVPGGFTEKDFELAKPHFDAAWQKYKEAGGQVKEFVAEIVDKLDAKQKAMFAQWQKGIANDAEQEAGVAKGFSDPEVATETPDSFELPEETRRDKFVRVIQNKLNRLDKVQDSIGKEAISEEADASLKAELFIGKASDKIEKVEKDIIDGKDSFLKRLTDTEISIDDFGTYLLARHAKERNKKIQDVNDKFTEGGSGLTDAEADQLLKEFDGTDAEKFATEFYDKITKAAMNIRLEAGLISQEDFNTLTNQFENYVPLKGNKDKISFPRTGKGFSVEGKEFKRARGRQSLPDNPFIQALVDYNEAVVRAEKNKVNQAFLQLVDENPNPKVWDVSGAAAIPLFDEKGNFQFANRLIKPADNVIEVKIEGKSKLITIHDKALAEGMKNLGVDNGFRFLDNINKYLRSINTIINPEFIITNFERDLQTAAINFSGLQSTKASAQVVKDVPSAIRGIWQNVRDKDKKNEWSDLYAELKATGGKIGWFDQENTERKLKSLERKARLFKKGNIAKKTIKETFDFITNVNEAVESGARLSAYKAMLDTGASKEEAARVAKNLTVNFNTKGQWGSMINSLYLFSNAGIQGTARIFKAMGVPGKPKTKGQKTVQAIAAGMVGASFMQGMINRWIAPDDYDQYSDYVKDNFLLFMLPNGKSISIKVPYGYNIFKALGTIAEDYVFGDITLGEAAGRLFQSAQDAFNPLGGGTKLQFLSPTVLDPFVQIVENKNFFGGSIRKEAPVFSPNVPDSQLFFKGVRQNTEAFTTWLNSVSGGDEIKSGSIDINPENIDHMIDFVTGGLGKFIANSFDTAGNLLTEGKFPEVNNIPVARQFIKEPSSFKFIITANEMLKESLRTEFSLTQQQRFEKLIDVSVNNEKITKEEGDKKKKQFKSNQKKAQNSGIEIILRRSKEEKFTSEEQQSFREQLLEAVKEGKITSRDKAVMFTEFKKNQRKIKK